MEAIGQAFALPLEDASIISQASILYSQWLLEKQLRPRVIEQDASQRFWQLILRHLTLLFQHRKVDWKQPNAQTFFNRHVELCRNVLRVFVTAGRTLEREFNAATWTTLLKAILGVTDYLLQDPVASPGTSIADDLADTLIRTLFELWLRSKTKDPELWRVLMSCFRRWKHRVEVIVHWNATLLALTRRVVTALAGHDIHDVITIQIQYPNSGQSATVTIPLPIDHCVYAWYQLLSLFGPIDQGLQPLGFSVALSGIGKIVDSLRHASVNLVPHSTTKSKSLLSIADGNSILSIFSPWLFSAISASFGSSTSSAFTSIWDVEEGRAEAISILCRIFSMQQTRKPFRKTYVHQFFNAVQLCLKLTPISERPLTGDRWLHLDRRVATAALFGLWDVWRTVHVATYKIEDSDSYVANHGMLQGLRSLVPNIFLAIQDLLFVTNHPVLSDHASSSNKIGFPRSHSFSGIQGAATGAFTFSTTSLRQMALRFLLSILVYFEHFGELTLPSYCEERLAQLNTSLLKSASGLYQGDGSAKTLCAVCVYKQFLASYLYSSSHIYSVSWLHR